MRKNVGQSKTRVDAFDKAAGRAKYTEDLCDRGALTTRLVHAAVAHGLVTAVDTAEAEQVPGVVRVFTCFDVPENCFPTAGHPWSTDPRHQDVCDRLLLSRHVRYYGDDVAVVVAEDDVAAAGRAADPREFPGERLGPYADSYRGLRSRLPGAGTPQGGGMV